MSEEVAEAVEVSNAPIGNETNETQVETEIKNENIPPPEGEASPEKIEEKNDVQDGNDKSKSKVGSVRGSKEDNLNERKSLWNIDQFIQQEIEVGNEKDENENENKNNKTSALDDDLENQTEEVNYESIAFADPDMDFSDDEALSLDIDASDVPTCELNKLDVYKTACKIIDVIPVSYYADNMNKDELIMRNHGLGPKGAKAISESLNKTQIQVLDLSGNWIDAGGKYLAKTIADNCFLTELNLSNNHLGIKGGEPMGYMIAQNGSLKILNLSKNNLSNREIKAIAEGLKENNMLLSLDLSHNKIGDIGALHIGRALMVNDSIKIFNIGWNEIRMKGIAAFFQCIKSNQTITDLSVNNNGAGDTGGSEIVRFIDTNRVITRINLSSCRLSDGVCPSLFKALEQNTGLIEINLDYNCFTDACFQHLSNFCQKTTVPRVIHFENIKFSEEISKKLEQLKEEKSDFTIYI